MVAPMTPLPVLGFPFKTWTLRGVDSFHSLFQIPRGVPVATLGLGNGTNPGLLPVGMWPWGEPRFRVGRGPPGKGEGLGGEGSPLLRAMDEYMARSGKEVEEKALKMEEQGWKAYLSAKADKSTTVGV
ncbi:Convert 5-aminoimidazole ribonucleotide (AIR), ATP, and bicarbonate to N5-CAIR, ADP, and Pi [Ectocarpus siliculosus]|uniref:phosphoribosylaminoimidazole carboxylase n=1 Tax=Ectocarpus siliculosus TaxID=2880 RepID=D7FI28_ECTSI|nr:Convert 5-aminoimidazole ribonucleotide (AIR), ATP, and bicarbonate to N5-CAIR, ADP, and Pi [Ectocarpus siliculosus]|eukprot:CBJ28654.1 Convert 5-aminoimidazole ribonucleotide (AIR), ATP, and bicarbonate to N5-CAIR, ADP, and Pi [Ectocarpus siliculosus]